MTETPAGRMARTMPELGNRELGALMSENQHREYAGEHVPAAWRIAQSRQWAERAVTDRAEDAQALGYVKASIDAHNYLNDRPVSYSDCASYWAALP